MLAFFGVVVAAAWAVAVTGEAASGESASSSFSATDGPFASFRMGQFTVSLVNSTADDGSSSVLLEVDHRRRPESAGHVWSGVASPSQTFVAAAGGDFDGKEDSGNFLFTDTPGERTRGQTVDSIESHCSVLKDCSSVQLQGKLLSAEGKTAASYTFTFTHSHVLQPSNDLDRRHVAARDPSAYQQPPSTDSDTLSFEVEIMPVAEPLTKRTTGSRIMLTWDSLNEAEEFFGLGEQYTRHGMRGHTLSVVTTEQGVGRGLQPLTGILDLKGPYHNSAGNWHTTYTSIPHYLTSDLRSVFVNDTRYMTFDFAKDYSNYSVDVTIIVGLGEENAKTQAVAAENPSPWRVSGLIYHGDTPSAIIEQHTAVVGRMPELPDWVVSGGLVAGWEGGTDAVRSFWKQLRNANISLAGFWLQDWTGLRKDIFGERLWWNWELDEDWYPGWGDLVKEIRNSTNGNQGPRMLTYMNPYLANTVSADKPNKRRDLWAEAAKLGFLVKNSSGQPYIQHSASQTFTFSAIDLTSSSAREWTKRVIRCNMLGDQNGCDGNATAVDGKMSGFMSDFGEYLPFDATLAGDGNGKGVNQAFLGANVHNDYPALWAQTCREAIRESALEGEVVFFSRSASARSPGESTLFWAGDQLTSWDYYDGMQSAVRGMLSGGLSGMSLTHSDIGGYTEFKERVYNIVRTKEILLRWVEFEAFSGAMMRTHPGLLPQQSAQVNSDDQSLAHFGFYSYVHKLLGAYRKAAIYEATYQGTPLMRYMFMEFPSDVPSWNITSQFMFGSEFLVAPIMEKGLKTNDEVYMPAGTSWRHIWTGGEYIIPETAPPKACVVSVPAPLGEVAAFIRIRNAANPAANPALQDAANKAVVALQELWQEWKPKLQALR